MKKENKMVRVYLEDICIANNVLLDWCMYAAKKASVLIKSGMDIKKVPDEYAMVSKENGSMMLCVDVPGYQRIEKWYPKGSWTWKT